MTYRDSVEDGTFVYRLRTVDYSNNYSAPTEITIEKGLDGPDTERPVFNGGSQGFYVESTNEVQLEWRPDATDNVEVKGYLIHQGSDYVGFVPASAPTIPISDGGRLHTYRVRVPDGTTISRQFIRQLHVTAQDTSGNYSRQGVQRQTGSRLVDRIAPRAPSSVEATSVDGGVRVTWASGGDDIEIRGYVVHAGDTYLGYVAERTANAPRTFLAPASPEPGTVYRVRTQDQARNYSPPTEVVFSP